MTRYASKDVGVLLVGGYDLLGATSEMTPKGEATTVDTTPLGTAWARKESPDKSATIEQDAWYDTDTASVVEFLAAELAGDYMVPVVMGLKGNTQGYAMLGMKSATMDGVERTAQSGDFHHFKTTYVNGDAVYGLQEGQICWALQSISGASGPAGGSNGADGTASSSNGATVYLMVKAHAYTAVTFKLQDSADNSTFLDVSGATLLTISGSSPAAPYGVAVEVSGTIRRYTRLAWASGTGTMTATVFAALVRH